MKRKGFTLIEVVISMALIALVIVGTMTLNAATIQKNVYSGQKTQAYELANQGIEALRTMFSTGIVQGGWEKIGTKSTNALTTCNGKLYLGGIEGVYEWNGSGWVILSAGNLDLGDDGNIRALACYNNQLIVGGVFTVGGNTANIAYYDTRWRRYTPTVDAEVDSLVVYKDPGDSDIAKLIVGGRFQNLDDILSTEITNPVAYVNNVGWQNIGPTNRSIFSNIYGRDILSLATWLNPDNTKNELIAGGRFNPDYGDTPPTGVIHPIGRWRGKGSGGIKRFIPGQDFPPPANAVAAWNDGSGDKIIAGAKNIYKWNGASWETIGTTSMFGAGLAEVDSLISYKGELVAGGLFQRLDGTLFGYIARKSTTSDWSQVVDDLPEQVLALAIYGTDLVAGGEWGISKLPQSSWQNGITITTDWFAILESWGINPPNYENTVSGHLSYASGKWKFNPGGQPENVDIDKDGRPDFSRLVTISPGPSIPGNPDPKNYRLVNVKVRWNNNEKLVESDSFIIKDSLLPQP